MSFIAEKKNISAHDLKNHRFSYFITQPRPYFVCFFDINYFLTLSRILFQCTAANQTFVKKYIFFAKLCKSNKLTALISKNLDAKSKIIFTIDYAAHKIMIKSKNGL